MAASDAPRRGLKAFVLVVGLAVAATLTGCGVDVEKREVASAADAFNAEAARDPGGACRLLAPRTVESLESQGSGDCATGLEDAGIPPAGARGAVSVAGHTAQVRYSEGAVFLSLFDDGWRVTAAGCTRSSGDPSVPYDCLVQGQ